MTKIWKYALLLGIMSSFTIALSVSAAEMSPDSPDFKASPWLQKKDAEARRLENMGLRLGLSAEQQEAIKPILAEEAALLEQLRTDDLTIEEKRIKRQELRNAIYEKIRPILTAEQQAKHEAQVNKSQEQRKQRRNKGGLSK